MTEFGRKKLSVTFKKPLFVESWRNTYFKERNWDETWLDAWGALQGWGENCISRTENLKSSVTMFK